MALSPDGLEAAVALWSDDLAESRLVVFSVESGEPVATFERTTQAWYTNPVYSNDGQRLAAPWAVRLGEGSYRGGIAVWDRNTGDVIGDDWQWGTGEAPARAGDITQSEWDDCYADLGFSNDGVVLGCGPEARNIATGEVVDAASYGVGFNTLPNGSTISRGRILTGDSPATPVLVRADLEQGFIAVRSAGARNEQVQRIDIDSAGWQDPSIALTGDASVAVVTRARTDGSRPVGAIDVIDIATAQVETIEIEGAPVTSRFDLTGDTYVLLTRDLQLLVFDTSALR